MPIVPVFYIGPHLLAPILATQIHYLNDQTLLFIIMYVSAASQLNKKV
jgi:hypothetical protein